MPKAKKAHVDIYYPQELQSKTRDIKCVSKERCNIGSLFTVRRLSKCWNRRNGDILATRMAIKEERY